LPLIEADGYHARIEYDEELDLFRSELVGLNGGADFYGKRPREFRTEFKKSIQVLRRRPTMSDTEKQVQRALDTYQSAVLAKNVETFMHLYDPDVRVFDTWGIWSYEGAAAWRVAVEGWFSSLGDERVRVTFQDVKIAGEQGFASMSAVVTYAGVSADGRALKEMQNRITWVLQASGHVLRIIHEHTSAPVGFEDAKAILERESRT
jgi:ketosteroid isomerase-like protein